MHRFNHDYTEIASSVNIQTIRSLHYYHDCVYTFKVLNDFINCVSISDLITERELAYNLRHFRPLCEQTCSPNTGFYSTINRLKRLWNTLPSHITAILNISFFNSAVRSLSKKY